MLTVDPGKRIEWENLYHHPITSYLEDQMKKDLAMKRTERLFTIAPNRGNLYSDDGSLLATSVSRYTIRFDAMTVSKDDFHENLVPLCDALAELFDEYFFIFNDLFGTDRKSHKKRYNNANKNIGGDIYVFLKNILKWPERFTGIKPHQNR